MNEPQILISISNKDQPEFPPNIVAWLEDYAAKIRRLDYTGARELFSPGIFGFGTKAVAYESLDDWHHNQWGHVWPKTTGFHFDLDTLRTIRSGDLSLCCVVCEWESSGLRDDGTLFPRHGRCTILLTRSPDNEIGWIGVHSHFSMPPA